MLVHQVKNSTNLQGHRYGVLQISIYTCILHCSVDMTHRDIVPFLCPEASDNKCTCTDHMALNVPVETLNIWSTYLEHQYVVERWQPEKRGRQSQTEMCRSALCEMKLGMLQDRSVSAFYTQIQTLH